MTKHTRSHVHLVATLALAAVIAGCGRDVPTAAPTRSFRLTPEASRDVTPVAGRHIFVMNGPVPSDFAAQVNAKGGTVVDDFEQIQTVVTSGLSDADAAVLAANGAIVANDVTARWAPTPDELNATAVSMSQAQASPQSPTTPLGATALGIQWNMFQINAPQAWAAGKIGNPAVEVAILDSGIDPTHQELAGLVDMTRSARVVATQTQCLFSNAPALWNDDFFHGTYVSGLVTTNNVRIAGTAPNVRLVAVKVLGSNGSGSFSDILCGLQYAVIIAHAKVINMSLGATFKGNTPGLVAFQQVVARVVDFAKSQGAVVVSAAGNDDKNLGNPHPFLELPCEAGDQICTSATSPADKIAHYSNFGSAAIDVAAPGGEDQYLGKNPTNAQRLASLVIGPCAHAFCGPGADTLYLVADGTSAAAPHVSGLAALIFSNSTLSPDGVMTLIRQSADNIGNQSKFGDGRINVARALGVQ